MIKIKLFTLNVEEMIEKNFVTVYPDDTRDSMMQLNSRKKYFPIVDNYNQLLDMLLDEIRS